MTSRSTLREELYDAKDVLGALADPIRQDIFIVLLSGPKHVLEITTMTDLARPTVSHHLKLLKVAGVVSSRKQGVRNYYHARPTVVFERFHSLAQAAQST